MGRRIGGPAGHIDSDLYTMQSKPIADEFHVPAAVLCPLPEPFSKCYFITGPQGPRSKVHLTQFVPCDPGSSKREPGP